MIIHETLENLDIVSLPHPRVLTVGAFDGLHRGHQTLIRRTVEQAHGEPRGAAIVFTFANHPLSILAPPYAPQRLISAERKCQILDRMGIDDLITPDFDHAMAAASAETFVKDILVGRCGVDRLVVGFDFRFGREGQGDVALLSQMSTEMGFGLQVLPALYHGDWIISSTRIREVIEEGRVHLAAEMLGRPYDLEGIVERGFGRGRTLGFPTANLKFSPDFVQPPSGVYAVQVSLNNHMFGGMMNIGSGPTFQEAKHRAEVFMFDYEGPDLYGQALRVYFIERLREERKFATVEELLSRIHVDEKIARAVLESDPHHHDSDPLDPAES